MRNLTVGQLRRALDGIPDDVVVLTPCHDHSYCSASVEMITALDENYGRWTEDYGESVTPEAEYGKRVPALVVS